MIFWLVYLNGSFISLESTTGLYMKEHRLFLIRLSSVEVIDLSVFVDITRNSASNIISSFQYILFEFFISQ